MSKSNDSPKLDRRDLRAWIARHGLGQIVGGRHLDTYYRGRLWYPATVYRLEGPSGPLRLLAANKRGEHVASYTRSKSIWEAGINSVFLTIANRKIPRDIPVRLVLCHVPSGRAYIHSAPDIRATTPDIRAGGADGEDVAWWPFDDFVDLDDIPPVEEPRPQAPRQPSILEILSGGKVRC